MRRQALLAAAMSGSTQDITFEFPLYLYADYYYGTLAFSTSLGSETYANLKQALIYYIKKYGERRDGYWYLMNPLDYGIEIYVDVNGELVAVEDFDYEMDSGLLFGYIYLSFMGSVVFNDYEVNWDSYSI